MPHVSSNRSYSNNKGSGSGNRSNNSSSYNPREEGYDDDQAAEIEAFESGHERIKDELRN